MRTHNLKMLPKIHEFFDFSLSGLKRKSPEWNRVNMIHKEFLEKAIVLTYTYNQPEASEELFEDTILEVSELICSLNSFNEYVIC